MNKSVLVVGIDPDTVDYSAPGLPPGLNADKIRAELKQLGADFAAAGLDLTICELAPGDDVNSRLQAALGKAAFACVVIGGGVRVPPDAVEMLEQVVDAVRRYAPDAPIAFNKHPQDSVAAALRWVG